MPPEPPRPSRRPPAQALLLAFLAGLVTLGLLHLLAHLTGDDDFVEVVPFLIVGVGLLAAPAIAAPAPSIGDYEWDQDGHPVRPNPAPRLALMLLAFGLPSMVWLFAGGVLAVGCGGSADADEMVVGAPAISGEWVVWEERSPWGYDKIQGFHLTSGERRAIRDAKSLPSDPAISGEWVVWADIRGAPSVYNIFGRRLDSAQERAICTAKRRQYTPAVSGEWVVWMDDRHGENSQDIYAYNLETDKEKAVCTAKGRQRSPDVSGEWVVWMDGRGAGYDIYAYNLATKEEQAICTAPGNQRDPAVSGEWVVWDDKRDDKDNPDIYAYNLKSGEERAICTAEGAQWSPAISGEWVVWTDERGPSGDSDIYALNLTSNEERAICTAEGNQWSPEISGEQVVWVDERESDPGYFGNPWGDPNTRIYVDDLATGEERPITE